MQSGTSTFRIVKNDFSAFIISVFAIAFLFFSFRNVCTIYAFENFCSFLSSMIVRLLVIGIALFAVYRSIGCWNIRVSPQCIEILEKTAPKRTLKKDEIKKITYIEGRSPLRWPFSSRTLIFFDGGGAISVGLLKDNFIGLLDTLAEYDYPEIIDAQQSKTIDVDEVRRWKKEESSMNAIGVAGIFFLLIFSAAILFLAAYLLMRYGNTHI